MSKGKKDAPLVNWRISLKTGAAIDLNVFEGDRFDKAIKRWVDALADNERVFFCDKFPQGDIWISPDDFSMALRQLASMLPQNSEKFAKVEGLEEII